MSSYIRRHGRSNVRINTSSTTTASSTTTSSATEEPASSALESPDHASTSSGAGAHHREPREKDLSTDHCAGDSDADEYIPPSAEADEDSGESSGESSDPESVQAFFSAATPSNDRHWWLLEFFKYLNLPDCGRKKSRNQLQQASQVCAILEELEPKGTGDGHPGPLRGGGLYCVDRFCGP